MKVYLNGEHYKSFDYKKGLTRWMDKDRRIFLDIPLHACNSKLSNLYIKIKH